MKDSAYFKIYGWMINKSFTISEAVVLAYIAANCEWHDGVCTRSLVQFADDLRLSRNTVKNAIATLSAQGFIKVDENTAGGGRGRVTQITIKGSKIDTLNITEKGSEIDTLNVEKGQKLTNKRVKNSPFSPCIIEKDIYKNKGVEKNAHTREELEKIIADYERKMHDPNGYVYSPTEEEKLTYEDAKSKLMNLDRARLADEWRGIEDENPDLKTWHVRGTGEQYARLLDKYGRDAVVEAIQYTANRIDLKFSYNNPLGYVEMNLRNRRNGR